MNSHIVAVDFGTSFTTAALRRGDAIGLVDLDGSAQNRIPSCVYLDETSETFLIGRAARNSGLRAPDAFERTPKRLIGTSETLLGGRLVAIQELVRAVYRRVFTECRSERDPDEVRITHPAAWPEGHREVLRTAAGAALRDVGWDVPIQLLAEPVAAAVEVASFIPIGSAVAVYDLGGGTFDVAVVRRSEAGFDVVGEPGGHDRCGGEEFDDMLLRELGSQIADPEIRRRLIDPELDDVSLLPARSQLRAAITAAKEELSGVEQVVIQVPLSSEFLEVTQAMFEGLIAAKINASVGLLLETIAAASRAHDLRDSDLVGVVLTGGSSRIPLVNRLIDEQTRLRVFTQPDRKGVVASGAARWSQSAASVNGATDDRRGAGRPRTQAVFSGAAPGFTCRLALSRGDRWRNRQTRLTIGDGDLVIREFEPDFKSLERWVENTRRRTDRRTVVSPTPLRTKIAELPAIQLWMLTALQDGSAAKYLHRCALVATNGPPARAIEIVAREDAAELADRVRLGKRDDRAEYAPLVAPNAVAVREQLSAIPKGRLLGSSDLRVLAESAELAHGLDEDTWAERVLARYGRIQVVERSRDTFMNGQPALYLEVNLGSPRVPIGAVWAHWWTGVVGDRAVAVAVESRTRTTKKRTESFRDLFTLIPAATEGADPQP
jgi:actin-like ATPase involved in cell morphogenesis